MSLILIDGTALVYRSHYAFVKRPLTAPSGETTSVAFGFCNALLRLLESRRPDKLAVVFDLRGPVFRNEIYEDYKANRKPMPDELAEQLPRLRELLEAWGLPILEAQGFEADDVIATLCHAAPAELDRIWIYSGDKDFLQLVDERTGLLKPGRRGDDVAEVGLAEVRRDHGLEPEALIDVFALSGDTSDNIPGAPGVGPKTALKLIREHGSLDALLETLPKAGLTPRLTRVLEENREQVLMSRDLFRMRDDVPLEYDWDDMAIRLPDGEAVRALLDELGLRQVLAMADRVGRALGAATAGDGAGGETDPEHDPWDIETRGFRLLEERSDIEDWLAGLPAGGPLAVDTETDGLRTDRAALVGVSFSLGEGDGVYIPVTVRGPEAQGDLFSAPDPEARLSWLRPLLAPLLADPDRLKIGQNLKFDAWILARHGLPMSGPFFDTLLAAYVLDPGPESRKLDDLALRVLGVTTLPYAALFPEKDRSKDILNVPLERLAVYAAEDAEVAYRLYERFAEDLAAEPELQALYRDLEMPLLEVLLAMERRGIQLDVDFLGELGEGFAATMADLEAKAHDAAGEAFNLQSPKQLSAILFEKLKLKAGRKTSSGYSTDSGVLERLKDAHPLPGLILEHRQLAKLRGTYVDALRELVDPRTGLLHTTFNQTVAATGRLSSSDPNLQNIPIRTEEGRRIRRAFVVREPGRLFLSADYSQVELRLLAHLSGDPELCRTFRAGGDVHRRTAALIAGVDEAAVTSEMRYRAKAINFGVIYGMGARSLAGQIGVKMREAGEFIDSYFRTYPGVRDYIDRCRSEARETGATRTLLGRRRPLPDITADNARLRSFSERVAVNTPIQGTAADLIKLAMLNLERELADADLRAMMLLQVHDELMLELPEDELAATEALVRRTMETVMDLDVPLVVDVHTGANWADAHD